MGKGYEKTHKVTRIFTDDYLVIKGWARQSGISMAEALHKLITKQPLPKPEPVAIAIKPASVTQPVFFTPKSIFDAVTSFKPKSISGNGVAHIKLKSIKGV